jgi:hypothetical protein
VAGERRTAHEAGGQGRRRGAPGGEGARLGAARVKRGKSAKAGRCAGQRRRRGATARRGGGAKGGKPTIASASAVGLECRGGRGAPPQATPKGRARDKRFSPTEVYPPCLPRHGTASGAPARRIDLFSFRRGGGPLSDLSRVRASGLGAVQELREVLLPRPRRCRVCPMRRGFARNARAAAGPGEGRAGLLSLRPSGGWCLLEVRQVLLPAARQQLDLLDGPGLLRGLL